MKTAKNDITLYCGSDLGVNLQTCVEIIAEGGALVNVETTAAELSKATFVVIKRDGDQIVGVGAIKQQRPWYARDKATKSGFDFDENLHELGYISVRHTHRNRGIAGELVASLVKACKMRPLFATTSNETMKQRLSEIGFQQRGNEWRGNNSMLSLWIKE